MRTKKIIEKSDLVLQKATYTCGPVTLLNVLRLKGDKTYSENELAILCDAKPNMGTDHTALVKVAERIGIEVVEVKVNASLADVEHHIDDNHFVIVNYIDAFTGEGHFSIVTDYDEESFYFADCYFGFFHLDKKVFTKWWYNQNRTIQAWFAAVK